MIHLPRALDTLPGAERSALELLVDLSRVVPVDDPAANVVRLEVIEDEAASATAMVERDWDIEHADGVVRISRGALQLLGRISTLERERTSSLRDKHDRVPSSENIPVEAALERRPVVSEAASILRASVIAAAGARPVRCVSPWPDGHRWAAAFTHDLDVVALWPLFAALRLTELLRKGDAKRVAQVIGSSLGSLAGSPVRDGVKAILGAERGLASTWFILCGTPTSATIRRGDLTYLPESPAAREIVAAIAAAGHEIALHGSFETFERDAAFAEQRRRLSQLADRSISGVRQHFLRIRPGRTETAMRAAGFRYDSTCGYADRNGFRAGVADVLPTAAGLDQVPFCFMDRAQSKYRGEEDPAAWCEEAVRMATACRHVEGLWAGIWHPNVTVGALGYPGAARAFASMVGEITSTHPYVATLDTIVRWRAARRSVRVRSVRADGSVDAYVGVLGNWTTPIPLEDGERRPRGSVK